MSSLINIYKLGYLQGINDSMIDYNKSIKKKFKRINKKEINSLLYDIAYVEAYNEMYKKLTLKKIKNIV